MPQRTNGIAAVLHLGFKAQREQSLYCGAGRLRAAWADADVARSVEDEVGSAESALGAPICSRPGCGVILRSTNYMQTPSGAIGSVCQGQYYHVGVAHSLSITHCSWNITGV
jgi:hypothetical protein